jgi:hypothetical protein
VLSPTEDTSVILGLVPRIQRAASAGAGGEVDGRDKPEDDNEDGPMAETLRDREFFGVLTWPHGFDIDPEYLRQEMAAAGELTRVAGE